MQKLSVDGKIILKFIVQKLVLKFRTGLNWLNVCKVKVLCENCDEYFGF
jgi:hypothetical protein